MLTLGPTFSTLLKLKEVPLNSVRFSLKSLIVSLSVFSILIKKSLSLPNFLTFISPRFMLFNVSLNDDTFIFLSLVLSSIKVPPLKSIPKFKPLKINNKIEQIIKTTDKILNNLKNLLKFIIYIRSFLSLFLNT